MGARDRKPLGRVGSASSAGSVALVAVLVLAGLANRTALHNPLFGSDTWPWLVSTRVGSVEDVARVAFSPIMSGTSFATDVARFYHPLTALSYALDQALFGISPFGFYATNVVFHLVAVAGVYALARGLGASWWASAAAASVLGLHPIAAATVPSLPRRQDLLAAALLLGSMSALVRARSIDRHVRWPWVGSALVLFGLALGAKEIAYAGILGVPLVTVAGTHRVVDGGAPRGVIAHRTLAILVAFVALETAAFAIRWQVLGGFGGYYASQGVRGSLDGIIELYIRPYVTDVLWPFQGVMPARLRDWLLIMAPIAVVVGLTICTLSSRRRWMAFIGVAWQAAFLLLYVGVHTSLSAYLLYVPLAGLALLVAALLDGTADWLTTRRTRSFSNAVGGAGAIVSGAACALVLVGIVRTSALVVDYTEFRDAGFVSSQFIDQAIPCISSAAPGTVVQIDGLPHQIDYGSKDSQFIDAYVFESYSVEALVRLLAPGTTARVEAGSSQDVQGRPSRVVVTCTPDSNGIRSTTRIDLSPSP